MSQIKVIKKKKKRKVRNGSGLTDLDAFAFPPAVPVYKRENKSCRIICLRAQEGIGPITTSEMGLVARGLLVGLKIFGTKK